MLLLCYDDVVMMIWCYDDTIYDFEGRRQEERCLSEAATPASSSYYLSLRPSLELSGTFSRHFHQNATKEGLQKKRPFS